MEIWYSSLEFGIFFPVLVFCTEKNLATLLHRRNKPLPRQLLSDVNGALIETEEIATILWQVKNFDLHRQTKGVPESNRYQFVLCKKQSPSTFEAFMYGAEVGLEEQANPG
jgi:hypothetical protein